MLYGINIKLENLIELKKHFKFISSASAILMSSFSLNWWITLKCLKN